jgi:catechol 2,3-dioxygenase-like lactoylglutathione lyase family enzyme
MLKPLINSLGGFSQVGMVVRDADKTMRYLAQTLGIGPFFVHREIKPDYFYYRGSPSAAPVITLGFAQAGAVQIEVIQQHNDVPSAYTEFLSAGREGAQHLSIWLDRDGYTAARALLIRDAGLTIVHETGDGAWSRFAYFETPLPGGLMIEIAEAKIAGAREMFDGYAKASMQWDGGHPIREAS